MEKKRKLTGRIYTYSKKARDRIIKIIEKFLNLYNINELNPDIIIIIDELVKNAIKANYQYLLLKDKIFTSIQKDFPLFTKVQIEEQIKKIAKDQKIYDQIFEEIMINEDINKSVREILNQESILIHYKNKAYAENREFNEDELAILSKLDKINRIKQRIKNNETSIIVNMEYINNSFHLEVINSAPILTVDLERIYNVRDLFKKYREEDRIEEFFINNIDESRSGCGLGYATIDTILENLGLDPEKVLKIISIISTNIMLELPYHCLKPELN